MTIGCHGRLSTMLAALQASPLQPAPKMSFPRTRESMVSRSFPKPSGGVYPRLLPFSPLPHPTLRRVCNAHQKVSPIGNGVTRTSLSVRRSRGRAAMGVQMTTTSQISKIFLSRSPLPRGGFTKKSSLGERDRVRGIGKIAVSGRALLRSFDHTPPSTALSVFFSGLCRSAF